MFDHDVTSTILDNHPALCFMDDLFVNWDRTDIRIYQGSLFNTLQDTFQKHSEVWNNGINREIVINILISIGTNFLLREDEGANQTLVLAHAILALENYTKTGDMFSAINGRGSAMKRRDICEGNKRDLLKFYRKRISCSCLREMHLEARKTLPKVGECFHCRQVFDRVSLMVCSRCRILQYCSRECQIAHWHEHKSTCDALVSVHKREEMSKLCSKCSCCEENSFLPTGCSGT